MNFFYYVLIFFFITSLTGKTKCAEKKTSIFVIRPIGKYLDCWKCENQDVYFVNNTGIMHFKKKLFEAEYYPFPDWFEARLRTETFLCGMIPGERTEWIGWFIFENQKDSLFLVQRIPFSNLKTMPRIKLRHVKFPKVHLSFGFLRCKGNDTWLFVLTPSSVLQLALREDGSVNYKEVLAKKQLVDSKYFFEQSPHLYKWVMDIDEDGWDDIIIPNQNYGEVYIQTEDHYLKYRGSISFPSYLVSCGAYMSEINSLPRTYVNRVAMWLEPSQDSNLPNMVLCDWKNRTFAIYKQYERGRFLKDELQEDVYGLGLLRQAKKCSLCGDGGQGVLINTIYELNRTRMDSVVIWKGKTQSSKPLILKNNSFLTWPVDIDQDGIIELFVYDTPSSKKIIDRVLLGSTRDLRLKGKFIAWQDKDQTWTQISKSFLVELSSLTPYDLVSLNSFLLNEYVEKQISVGSDLNEDGYNDIVWTEKDNCIHILLLRKKGQTITIFKEQRISMPQSIMQIQAIDCNRNGTVEILVRCHPLESNKCQVNQNNTVLSDYYILHQQDR